MREETWGNLRMENITLQKSRRRERLSSVSFSSNVPIPPYHYAAVHSAPATTLVATADVTSVTVSRSTASNTSLAGRCSLILTLVLASSMFSLHHNYPPTLTGALAARQAHPPRKATASHGFRTDEHPSVAKLISGALSAKPTSRIFPVDRHGTKAAATASSTTKGGLFGAGEVGGRHHTGSPLPILVRQPYMTDHPELTRFPLSVDADLTDESFEAVEKASLEIARAVRQQQQREQRREREEQYLSGELRPSPAMPTDPLSTTVENSRVEREGIEGVTESASRGSLPHTGAPSHYKFVESSARASSPQGDDWDFTWPVDEVDEYDEEEVPAARQSTYTIGGRLIVGLTEITFPEMKSTGIRVMKPGYQTQANGSIMRDSTKPSNDKSLEGARGGEGSWADDGGHGGDAQEKKDKGGGEPLSHEEAVREANQKLRLEHLQDLGIVKSVKVLENVGLVVLEFQNHLSVEEIKETVKTLWQRNRSTWLIEPDSEVVFRGRDSFEHGDFVPVVPTEEEEAAGEEHNVEQAHTFLPGQDQQSARHDRHNVARKEAGSQQNIRTSTSLNRTQGIHVFPREKGFTKNMVTPRPHEGDDAAQIRECIEEPKQRSKQTPSEQMTGRSAKNSISDVSKQKVLESTDSTKGRLPKLEESKKVHSHTGCLPKLEERRKVHMAKAQGNVARTAMKRGLALASSAPAVQPAQKRFYPDALYSKDSLQVAKPESGSQWDEPHQRMTREATISGMPRDATYDTAERNEPDPSPPHTAFPWPGDSNDSSFDAHIDIGERIADHATSSTPYNSRPTSLLKPHTGIVSLSLYDAAQEAVQEAIEERVAFRNVNVSPSYAGRHECLEALAACEKRLEFAVEDADRESAYRGGYSSESTSANSRSPSTTTGDQDPYKYAYTEDGFSNRLIQPSDEQTSNEEQCKNQVEPEAVETEVTEHDAPVTSPTEAEAPVAPAEAPPGADAQSAIGQGAPVGEEISAVVQESGSNQEQPDNSAQRRIIFASSVAPVSEKHLPNDQYFSRQWAYHGPRVNVQAVEAWNLLYKHRLISHREREGINGRSKPVNHKNPTPATAARKVEPIIVAVIDTGELFLQRKRHSARRLHTRVEAGIDYTHEDLRTQMWTNKGEIPNNGVDDDAPWTWRAAPPLVRCLINTSQVTAVSLLCQDKMFVLRIENGYVDDYFGYNFEKNTSDPMDYNGHGTHVAGIIGAAANNRRGITGVNWEVKLMPLKFTARSAAAAEAIDYSLRMGAQISTNSWGYASPSEGLKLALKKTATKGQLFVSAVDNAGKDNTYTPDYPPNWGYDKRTKQGARNILRVANLTAAGGVAGTSNFGPNNVDVVAPGTDIISTVPTRRFPEGYGYKTGTSMATPLVAGIAAMVWSANPALTAGDVRDSIVRTSTRLRTLEGFVIAGNVNAYAAVLDVLGLPKESASGTQKGTSNDFVPSVTAPAIGTFSPAMLAALTGNRLVYAQPVPPPVVNGNVFPSEEAFFQHIAQTQPSYAPLFIADYPYKVVKPSINADAEDEPSTASSKVAPPAPASLVSSLTSLLGPLHKLLYSE